MEEGNRHKRLDFLVALEVGSVNSAIAIVAGKAWWRPGMARGGRRLGSWPDGPQVLVGWVGGQLGRRGKFSKETSRAARNVWAEIRSCC
jgi:hypothetical protein